MRGRASRMHGMALLLAAAAGFHVASARDGAAVVGDANNTTPPIYAIAGFGGSGTRAAAMLLEQAGVFVVTGGSECEETYPEGTLYPENACIRSDHDHNSPCSDQDLDYHASTPPHRPKLGTVCYTLGPDFEVAGAEHASSIQSQYNHMVQRAQRCSQQHDFNHSTSRSNSSTTTNPMFGKDVLGVGFKHYRPLFSIPHYARWSKQTGVEVRYAIVIRDGRDLALSFGGGAANSLNKAAGVLGLKGMRDIMINDIISRVQVWSEAYQQVLSCAQAHLKHVTVIRIEDLVVESLQTRRDNIAAILTSLAIPFTESKLNKLAQLFDMPIDAPSDFRTSHYGRWKRVTNETESSALFQAAKPALEAYNYSLNGREVVAHTAEVQTPPERRMPETAGAGEGAAWRALLGMLSELGKWLVLASGACVVGLGIGVWQVGLQPILQSLHKLERNAC